MTNTNLTFSTTTDLHDKLMQFEGLDINLNKLIFKNSIDNWQYKSTGSRIIEEQSKGIMIWESSYMASNEGYLYGTILVTHKDRYIKSKDKLILKEVVKVEIY